MGVNSLEKKQRQKQKPVSDPHFTLYIEINCRPIKELSEKNKSVEWLKENAGENLSDFK